MRSVGAIEKLYTCPDATALVAGDETVSWQGLFSRALAWVDAMAGEGLEPGDHVAVLMSNRADYFAAHIGSVLAGVWLTPVNTHLTDAEIDYVLNDSGAKVLLTDRSDTVTQSGAVMMTVPLPEYRGEVAERLMSFASAPAGGFMMYTSGTTGRPKGVKRTSPGLVGDTLNSWVALARSIGLDGSSPHLVSGPIYHAAPGLYGLYDLLNGATVVVMPRWDAQQCLALIEAHSIGHTHLVPTMFVRLLRERDNLPRAYDLSSLQLVLHGAAPTAPEIKREMIAWWGDCLVEYWGGSESGIITRVDSAEWLAHPGTVGRPLPQFELTVRDEHFAELPHGEVGMLYARRAGMSRPFSYFNDEEKTAEAYTGDWFTLGDLGWVDREGYAYIADRRSNLIISGGVNIYPAEVEAALLEHPAVLDVAVVGIPDAEWGKRVHAYVQLQGTLDGDVVAELTEFAGQRLARFKVPRSMEILEQLPRTEAGKLYLNRLPV